MQTQADFGDHIRLLESQNRMLRVVVASMLVILPVLLFTGMSRDEKGEVRAKKLTLVDAQGTECAWLEVGEEGFPQLRFEKRGSHLTMALGETAAFLASGSRGRGVSFFGVNEEGPYLNFRGKNLKNGAWLGVQEDGSTGLHLYGETLRVGAAMRVESNGAPVLRLNARTGALVSQLPE